MTTRTNIVHVPEDVTARGDVLDAGSYLVRMPADYDPAAVTGEDILLDDAVALVGPADVVIEYDDAGPDERGRRSFTALWTDSIGKARGQCFRMDPAEHIARWRAQGRRVTEIETVQSKES